MTTLHGFKRSIEHVAHDQNLSHDSRTVGDPPASTSGVSGVEALALLSAAIYASIFPIAELFTEVVVLRTYDADGGRGEFLR